MSKPNRARVYERERERTRGEERGEGEDKILRRRYKNYRYLCLTLQF